MQGKVLYHVGEEIGLRTKGTVGRLALDAERLVIKGDPGVSIPLSSLRSVELLRLHGTGRMVRIVHANGTLFVSIIRFSFFGLFAVVNFFATGKLASLLQSGLSKDNSE